MKKAIIVGWINKGKMPDCGETVKNQLMIQQLQNLGVQCYQCDFKNWKRHPWVFLYLVQNMIFHRDAAIILSTSVKNIYGFLKVLKKIGWKQNIINWVIGGTLGDYVERGVFDASVIGYANHTLVESNLMVQKLDENKVGGVKQVPNFKPITYIPEIKKKYPGNNQKLRLVFMSRIMPEKGCDYIIEAARALNSQNYQDAYTIDFYGKIAKDYENQFFKKIEMLPNVDYKGFLNFHDNSAYDTLSEYDMMLFPTYWKGEGFAGVFIDSFVAGVPLLATDWAHNSSFLEAGKNAIFIKPHDVNGIIDEIRNCINGVYDLDELARGSQNEASKYDAKNVITNELLSEIGIL